MDAFDSDVLIYACVDGHPLGRHVAALFDNAEDDIAGSGSVLLLPELLARPLRQRDVEEVEALRYYLRRLQLSPVTHDIATLATALAARHRLKPIDATHLATAVTNGASRFVTNNRRDFSRVDDIEIVFPDELDGE